mgnify:CR=1 FL=1
MTDSVSMRLAAIETRLTVIETKLSEMFKALGVASTLMFLVLGLIAIFK